MPEMAGRPRAQGFLGASVGRIRRALAYYGITRRGGAEHVAVQHVALTDPGKRRSNNQDQATTRDLGGGKVLLLVADGVGGAGGGEVASEAALESVVATLSSSSLGDPAEALRQAVRTANDRVRELATTDERLSSMATTLVVAIIDGPKAWIISTGDSRAYLCGRGSCEALTEDDSWVAEQVRAGALTPDEAAKSPYQNVITRGVGVEDTIDVDVVYELRLEPGQSILLCSDGLYRCVSPEEIAATLDGLALVAAAERLIAMANEAGGPDNISVALYRHG